MNPNPSDSSTPIALALTGAPNFRDLGGHVTAGGRTVRHGRLFRSDHLADLSPADLALLASALGPAPRVIDLRGTAEREAAACAIAGATVHSLPIEPTIVQRLAGLLEAGERLTAETTVALMQETYRNFVRHNTPRFADLFRHVLDDAPGPLVFHCTAGKDRTGFA
ncbi:MAG TPA: tyrosine-protein phosphatase, partial [Ramlibacter sp.]|nr:tyrosine-protein phosphatase [Ramlibacter sp.]